MAAPAFLVPEVKAQVLEVIGYFAGLGVEASPQAC